MVFINTLHSFYITILICNIDKCAVFQIDILYVFYSDLLVRYIIWHTLTRKQGCIATTLCVNKMYYFLLFYIISASRLLEHYHRNAIRSMPYSVLHPVCLADFHYNTTLPMPCSYLHPVCLADFPYNPNLSMPCYYLHPDCLADFLYNTIRSMPCYYLHPDCLAD